MGSLQRPACGRSTAPCGRSAKQSSSRRKQSIAAEAVVTSRWVGLLFSKGVVIVRSLRPTPTTQVVTAEMVAAGAWGAVVQEAELMHKVDRKKGLQLRRVVLYERGIAVVKLKGTMPSGVVGLRSVGG